ncbi:hypothetical protein FHY55_17820 [Oceanicola sp. D3]|uniref:sensor histidine kinase n=1 Tax=Oceanicola sp. D3 TaxID=2587163 RepID=UPI0011223C4A|nr:ATP-binding protein [Oceanicola sp. D3]QDC10976.1 hypothetical protein FHY55_17820 [Oceanicola sp. D3]
MTDNSDYSVHLGVLRSAERVRSAEFSARLLLLLIGTATGTLLMGLTLLPLWLGVYYAAVGLEKFVLWRWPQATSRRFFAVMVGISLLIASLFAALPVYLWLHENNALKYGAMILLVGGVLNVFLVRARIWQISAAYMAPLGGAFLAISASTYEAPGGGPLFYTTLILSATIICYFLIAVYEANRSHRRLLDTERQFFQAQKMEAVGTLAGGLAHDFNNMLSVVQGNLEMIRTAESDSDREAFCTEALTACWRGAALTRQLLALSRGPMMEPVRLDPEDVLLEVERLVRRVAPPNIGLSVTAEPDLPHILADETTLQAALLNLAINARDAMPEGGRMHFQARHLTREDPHPAWLPSGAYVALSVCDNGIGIPEEIIGKVFDPFFSTKAKGHGTGLGLSMVEGFAHQANGHAHAESQSGHGSRFTLYLPAVSAVPRPAAPARGEANTDARPCPKARPARPQPTTG